MISARLSRWTLLFFGCALVNFVIAQALSLSGITYPLQFWANPGSLIALHLVTIGWLLLLMLGAMLQFVPVMTSRALPSQNLALASLLGIEIGLIVMICGLVAMAAGASSLTLCLPVGGSLVILGILVAAFDITVPLLRARPLPLSGRMVLTALVFLIATIGLGLTLSLALSVPSFAPALAPLLAHGVGYHALAGLGGWFTIAAMGVSYKLFPMFTLAPEDRGLPGELVLYLSATGFAVAVIGGLIQAWHPAAALGALELFGYALVLVAVAVYLADVVRIYRTRKRAVIELQNRAAIGAFAMLALSALLAGVSVITGTLAANMPLLIYLVLFGWLGGLGLTQLYKIVPFLTWLSRFGQELGRGRVPRVQDLVDEQYGSPWFVIYFAGVLLAAPAIYGVAVGLFRVGITLTLLATLMLVLEYWRAWRGYYEARREEKPKAPPFMLNKEDSSHGNS
jgi:hypothetical protein